MHVPTRYQVADLVASVIGSWPFIFTQSALLACWVLLNVRAGQSAWDPYPFILLNLALSFQAAYTGPIILISANRQAEVDRRETAKDHAINEETLAAIRELEHRLVQQHELLVTLAGKLLVEGHSRDVGQ